MGTLTPHRQTAAMTQTAVATQIHDTLDVHGVLATQVALDLVILVDGVADTGQLVVGQI